MSLQQHLALAANAYGADLPLPVHAAPPRPAVALRPAASPRPQVSAAATDPVAAAPPAPAAHKPALAPTTTPEASTMSSPADGAVAALQALRAEVMPCTRCKLHFRGRCDGNAVYAAGTKKIAPTFSDTPATVSGTTMQARMTTVPAGPSPNRPIPRVLRQPP